MQTSTGRGNCTSEYFISSWANVGTWISARGGGKRRFRFRDKLFILDATVIELRADLFDRAKFQQTKGAVKLHLLLDHDGYLPAFAHITEGKVHEVEVAQTMNLPASSIVVVVIDKGYIDYELFWKWTGADVSFVTRQKDNARYRVLEERHLPMHRNILSDQTIELEGFYSQIYKDRCRSRSFSRLSSSA
jgi:hypothetical protein